MNGGVSVNWDYQIDGTQNFNMIFRVWYHWWLVLSVWIPEYWDMMLRCSKLLMACVVGWVMPVIGRKGYRCNCRSMRVCCRNFPASRSCLGAQRLTSILFIDIGLLVYRHSCAYRHNCGKEIYLVGEILQINREYYYSFCDAGVMSLLAY